MENKILELAVVGGGAAGFFAAIHAAPQFSPQAVQIFEGSPRFLTKVKISGGGRCNVTHACFDPRELVLAYPRGGREMLGPLSRFGPKEMVNWLRGAGVVLKTEADGRMFPVTDDSETIVNCLSMEAGRLGVELNRSFIVKNVVKNEAGQFKIETSKGHYFAHRLLLATGSSPLGYRLAESLGHHIISPKPSLFTFVVDDARLLGMAGTSFKQTSLRLLVEGQKKIFSFKGPLLITHWGLSGPAVLKLSAFAARALAESNYSARLEIDFDAAFGRNEAQQWFDFNRKEYARKRVASVVPKHDSKKHWEHLCHLLLKEAETKRWADLTSKEQESLTQNMVGAKYQVSGRGVFKDEFVTAGGVDLKEIQFKNFESKICPGLYFAGEILDIDGITGGFNFQNAWTSGFLMGTSLSKSP